MQYERLVASFGEDRVDTIQDAAVVVVGLGTTGCLTAELLVRNGIDVKLLDHDVVEQKNLVEQLLYTQSDVGEPKVDVAVTRLEDVHDDATVSGHRVHLCADTVDYLEADVVVDCTDNMYTRFVINDYAMREEIPWVYAGVADDAGLVYAIDGSPCFNCVFGGSKKGATCHGQGVVNAAASFVSSVQVRQVMRVLTSTVSDELIRLNVTEPRVERLQASERSDCPTCNGIYEYLDPDAPFVLRFCPGTGGMRARPTRTMQLDLDQVSDMLDVEERRSYAVRGTAQDISLTVYDMGEVDLQTRNKDTAHAVAEEIYDHAV